MDAYPPAPTVRQRASRLIRGSLAATAALALAFAGVTLLPPTDAAEAGPATVSATATTITATGAYTGTVPAGICTVTATVLGAAGGSAVSTTSNANGAGARITATYPVAPGMSYSGTVGGGGGQPSGSSGSSTSGPAGSNGGGAGGTSGPVGDIRHHGAGGGGYTDFSLGGTLAILAGGGGGAGGGHSDSTNGAGGDAGLPTGTGVANGSTGNPGKDYPVATVGGGAGGSTTPGAGGTNSQSPGGATSVNGFAGSGRTGGAGGDDTNPDAGGGGGGGYAGGGGGASTIAYNTQVSQATEIAGAGGGGGSSYVAPSIPINSVNQTPTGISATPGAKITASVAGTGAAGSVSLTWNACAYDLSVDKSVSTATAPINSTVTWTVAITNNGPNAMTQGDTVTLTDTLPGAGATTITSIAASGGTPSALLGDGAITCDATAGDAMPTTLECSRPYQIGSGIASGVRGLNVGETLTVIYTQVVTDAAGTVLTNTATVTDRPSTPGNNTDTATTTVIAPPSAVDDERTGLAIGTAVTVPVTTNDTGTLATNSVVLWNPTSLTTISSPYVVAGEGTWTVASDQVTFTPLASFLGDPTPVTYRITATNGLTSTATVTLRYLPAAADDFDLGNMLGTTVNVPVLVNDTGDFDAASLRIAGPAGVVLELVVAGEGRWLANSDGSVTFFPEAGFKLDPAPVGYRVTDVTGDDVEAEVTVTYLPVVAPDVNNGNLIGAPVVVDVLANDDGDFDLSTLRVVDPTTHLGVLTLTVPGEGIWTVDATTGQLTFTPAPGYLGNPTPADYTITDLSGDVVTALVTVTYLPIAADDQSLLNPAGTKVTIAVLGNDVGLFDTTTPRLMSRGAPMMSMAVAGEGSWRMQVSSSTVTFEPLAGFLGDPTPVPYRVADINGNWVTANVRITYLQPAALALTGASVDLPLFGSLGAIAMGIIVVLFTRVRRVARHRM